MPRALIGVTSQDASYLAEFLIAKGYGVRGLKRRSSSSNADPVDQITLTYRENNGLHASCGILLNHESPER